MMDGKRLLCFTGGQILFYAFMMLSNWMMLAILTSASWSSDRRDSRRDILMFGKGF